MSAYAHQMEREFSARSLSSREDSEMGSHYTVESGFYMTSFAATIFIGSLVTTGVLLITLLISLTVMLQSCQNRSKGVIELPKVSDDYDYCRIFALHAELNNLGPEGLPSVCRSFDIQHVIGGRYGRDLIISLWVIERYFDTIVPLDDGLDVVLMDIDDIFPPNPPHTYPTVNWSYQHGCSACSQERTDLKQRLFLRLYMKLKDCGWSLVLLSRKPKKQQNATLEHLISAGYRGWSSVIMRLDVEMEIESREYFSGRRLVMQKEGFRISGVISSQMDALTGPCLGRIFKLPNPVYYYFEEQQEQTSEPYQRFMVAPSMTFNGLFM